MDVSFASNGNDGDEEKDNIINQFFDEDFESDISMKGEADEPEESEGADLVVEMLDLTDEDEVLEGEGNGEKKDKNPKPKKTYEDDSSEE
ncbi:hypothetical protein TrLO_g7091 [Triparma laevis f. longispina]|uniref:Uncharacterized protein n=1 Tax=Triparma laevis f. longispina TaxID=1714387 RepID=A0A9W7FQ77_9STRA|nr:hypothetical protein TrLO_g7091 [Triparma laevis f. longispina]